WHRQQQPARSPMERASDVPFLVVARRDHFGLFATDHPAGADLGIEVNVHLVLKDDRLVGWQRGDQTLNFAEFGGMVGVARPHYGPWPAPDEVHPSHPATYGFGTDANALLFPQQQRQQGTR